MRVIATLIIALTMPLWTMRLQLAAICFLGIWVLAGCWSYYAAGRQAKRARTNMLKGISKRQQRRIARGLVAESAILALMSIIAILQVTV